MAAFSRPVKTLGKDHLGRPRKCPALGDLKVFHRLFYVIKDGLGGLGGQLLIGR